MMLKLRNLFLSGLIISLPIIITIYIIVWFIEFFDNLIIVNLLPTFLANIPGVGIVLSILIMTLIGLIAKNYLGNYFIIYTTKLLNKIPLVKSLYSTIKQILDTILSSNSQAFKDAVLVQYPSKGIWMIGFITSEVDNEIKNYINKTDPVVSIFIPTTPNPTSGFLIFIPKSEVKVLNIKTDEAMKLIISGGVVKATTTENTQ